MSSLTRQEVLRLLTLLGILAVSVVVTWVVVASANNAEIAAIDGKLKEVEAYAQGLCKQASENVTFVIYADDDKYIEGLKALGVQNPPAPRAPEKRTAGVEWSDASCEPLAKWLAYKLNLKPTTPGEVTENRRIDIIHVPSSDSQTSAATSEGN